MEFGFTEEQEQLRHEVRDFLSREVTDDVKKEIDSGLGYGPATWEFLRKAGARGYLTPSWPKEHGGLGKSHVEYLIICEELAFHGAPERGVASGMAGRIVLQQGSDELKQEFLPRISGGEIEFALGYTEPQAGSDLAGLEIRAQPSGDYYVLNGQKVFNTAAHYAQYHWLMARTADVKPKHKGVSLFIVDLRSPGITISPLWIMDGRRTNEVFYDDVKVHKKYLVGQENKAFYYIAEALAVERMFPVGELRRRFDELVAWVRGTAAAEDPIVRDWLAKLEIELRAARLLNYRNAAMIDQGIVPSYEGSEQKIFVSELWQKIYSTFTWIAGLYSQLQPGSKWAPLNGTIERFYRYSIMRTVVAGSSEIQRNIIAQRGLGLPR